MDQLGPEAFQDQPGADDPAEQEAEGRAKPAAWSRPASKRGRQEGRPRVEHRQGRDRVIAGEPAVLLHPGRDPLDDLGPEREPEELAVREHARPRRYQGAVTAQEDQSPALQRSRRQQAVGPPHHHEASPDAATSAGPDRPLEQASPAPSRPRSPTASPRRIAPREPPEARLGRDDQQGQGRVGRRQLRLGDHDRHRRQGQGRRADRPPARRSIGRASRPAGRSPRRRRPRPAGRRTGCRRRRRSRPASASRSGSACDSGAGR